MLLLLFFCLLQGTQIAKDAADIILLDDNFASIVTAAKWGRNVYASIQKFLQFQLTVNISAVVTALVGSFAYAKSPLAAIQLLWVNLLMDALASLALASEPPTEELLKRDPVNRSNSIITNRMWGNMLGQSGYQLIIIMVLLFKGPDIWGFEPGHIVEKEYNENSTHYTFIFNAFVWCQLFNEINSRSLNGEFNVFRGIEKVRGEFLSLPFLCSSSCHQKLTDSLLLLYRTLFSAVSLSQLPCFRLSWLSLEDRRCMLPKMDSVGNCGA